MAVGGKVAVAVGGMSVAVAVGGGVNVGGIGVDVGGKGVGARVGVGAGWQPTVTSSIAIVNKTFFFISSLLLIWLSACNWSHLSTATA